MSISVDPISSPRIITVLSPLVFIAVQDLIDEIRNWEDDNLEFPHLVNASGKDDLGGGTAVGITMQLQNARIAFEARPGPSYTQCTIAGGNTVAKDEFGAVIDPIEVTAFTQVVLSQSSSPTIVNSTIADQVEELKFMVESLRETHRGYGQSWFVDPVYGDDSRSGSTVALAVKTITKAIDIVEGGRGDVIYLLSTANMGVVVVDENIVLTKDDVFIRGPGRGIEIKPTSGVAITIEGHNCAVSGIVIRAPTLSSFDCLVVNAPTCKLSKIYVVGAGKGVGTGNGIVVRGGDYSEFFDLEIEKCGGSGLLVTDAGLLIGPPREITVNGTNFYDNGRSGIEFVSIAGGPETSTRKNRLYRCFSTTNGRYGIEIDGNTCQTTISQDCILSNNTLGSVLDGGHDTNVMSIGNQVWEQHLTGNEVTGTPGKRLKDIKTFATALLGK